MDYAVTMSGDKSVSTPLGASFWVRIASANGDGKYGWVEQTFTPSGVFEDALAGRSGTTSASPAFEPNGVRVRVGTYCKIEEAYFDPILDWVFVITGGGLGGPAAYATVVTDVCGIGLTVEYQTLDLASGELSDAVCVEDPDGCCSGSGSGPLTPQSEIQTVTFTGVTDGTFTLDFSGTTTAAISYSSDPDTMVSLLYEALIPVFGMGNFAVTQGGTDSYTITFSGGLENADLPEMTVDDSGLDGTASVLTVQDGYGNEVQLLTVGGTTGGLVYPSYRSATATIPLVIGSVTSDSVTDSLLTIGMLQGTVTAIGGEGGPFVVVFSGDLGLVDTGALTTSDSGGATSSVSVESAGAGNSAQSIVLSGTDGSTFVMSYEGVDSTTLTYEDGVSPTAQEMLDALQSIPALLGNVIVKGDPSGEFVVVFSGDMAGTSVPPLEGTQTSGTVTVTVTVISGGSDDTVTVGCCPDPVPKTLYLTVVASNTCTCLDGSYTMLYDEGSGTWKTTFSACSGTVTFTLLCLGTDQTDWSLAVSGCGTIGPIAAGLTACGPLDLNWTDASPWASLSCCSLGATINLRVTE